MELVQDLFVTASLAIVLSFLVVKLISMATMIGDAILPKRCKRNFSGPTNELQFTSVLEARLSVQNSQSETNVDAFGSQIVHRVDSFQSQRQPPFQVDSAEESEHPSKDIREEAVELHSPGILPMNDFRQPSNVVELPETSPEQSTNQDADDTDSIPLHEKKKEREIVDNALKQREGGDDVVPCEEIGVESYDENGIVAQSKDIVSVRAEYNSNNRVEKDKDFEEGGDDDWEGIERTELEKVFAAAAKFVDGDRTDTADERLSSIERDVQMEMYGLKKIAMEGPCHESQPMALKISARAKWNAWQKLGNMNPEEAMEKYISLLSNRIPDWMEQTSTRESTSESSKADIGNSVSPRPGSSGSHQLEDMDKRHQGGRQGDHVLVSELDNQAQEKE